MRDEEGLADAHQPKRTEEEIRACTIGELNPLTAPVLVLEYNPEWPLLFQHEAARVRRILGDRVKLLEHAGSTAVAGLPAKPVIDIVLALADSSDEAAYLTALQREGYMLRIREPHWFEHRLFQAANPRVNLHVFTVGCPEIGQMLLFRDWLRSHQEDRDLYGARKRELAKLDWTFVQHYADAKTGIVHEILERARVAIDERPTVEEHQPRSA